jgi:hypothetical protein
MTGSFRFAVQVMDSSAPQQTATSFLTINVPQTLAITTTSRPNGKLGTAYAAPALAATGGTQPYGWAVVSGSLPPGLSLSSGGVIGGTPSVAGSFTFTVRATDSGNPAQTATQNLTINIPPVILTTTLPNGLVQSSPGYSQTLSATPTTATPLNWTVSGGVLPPGLQITDPVNGVISGTPTMAGMFPFTIQVTDSAGQSATANLSITIQPMLVVPAAALPIAVVGAFYAEQLTATGPPSPSWSVISGILPPGISLNSGGSLVGGPNTAGTFSFTVQVASSNPTQTAQQSFTIVVNPALSITTLALPGAILAMAYPSPASPALQLNATGGRLPYSWSNIGAPLPPGMSLSASGVLSGTPSAPGNYTLTLQIQDTPDTVISPFVAVPAQLATRNLLLTVANALTITTTATLPNGAVGIAYSQTLAAAAGTAPFTWSVIAGALPDGLTLSPTDGTITGMPATANTFNFTIGVTDSSSPAQTASKAFSIIVQPVLTVTAASPLPLAVVGAFYSTTLSASGPSPLTWSVTAGIAPPGLTVTSTGTLAGTPSVSGTYDFTVQASGGMPVQMNTKALEIVVNPALTITTVAALPDAKLSAAYSVSLVAAGGLPPYTWTNLGAGMPPGLSLTAAGLLSGTPTSPGSFSFTAQVSDSFTPQQMVSRTFSLVVATTVTITTTSLPNAVQNVAYSQQLQATGTAPLVWAVTSGTLPAGLTFSAGGLLSGMPTVAGAQTFAVTVTDARSATSTQTYTLTVDPPIAALTITALPATIKPAQVTAIAMTLATPHPSLLTGTLTLAFVSSADVPSDDPATQFSTGSRSVSFTIPAGQTAATFASPVMLLTGTVAGTLTLTANFDNGPSNVPVATTQITAIPPQFTNVTAVRTAVGIDVQITGYAPARRVTSAQFSFVVKNGSSTQTEPFSEDVTTAFATWFQSATSTPFGSAFSFVQSFNVSGNTSAIQSVTVMLQNAQGSTTSAVVPLQ